MLNSGQVTPLPKGTSPEDNPTGRDALEGLIQESSRPTLQPSPAPKPCDQNTTHDRIGADQALALRAYRPQFIHVTEFTTSPLSRSI